MSNTINNFVTQWGEDGDPMTEKTPTTEKPLRYVDLKGVRINLAKEAFEAVFSESAAPEERKNRIFFITNFGVVFSDPESVERPEASEKTVDGLLKYIDNQIEKLLDENPQVTPTNIGSFVRVNNAAIMSFDGRMLFGTGDLILFSDSIQAVMFGRARTPDESRRTAKRS